MRYLFLTFFFLHQFYTISVAQKSGVSQQDYDALVAFYNATDGVNWMGIDNNWFTTDDVATWSGITVENGRVTKIQLKELRIKGTLPPEIGNLSELIELSIIGQAVNIYRSDIQRTDMDFFMHTQKLHGEIPKEIGKLKKLKFLTLSYGYLQGSIPDEISELANLEIINLSYNYLSGNIPAKLFELDKLNTINLSNNKLSGKIPSTIKSLTNLKELNIGNNYFEYLPNLKENKKLENLNIGNNSFNFEGLKGISPDLLVNFEYKSQKKIEIKREVNGNYHTLIPQTESANNKYAWYIENQNTPISHDKILKAESYQSKTYYCIVTNEAYPKLSIRSENITVMKMKQGVIEDDFNYLRKIYEYSDGKNWKNNTNWLSNKDVSTWYGITVENGHVKSLLLPNNNLKNTGQLSLSISFLKNLTVIDLSYNILTQKSLSTLIGPKVREVKIKGLNLTDFSGLKWFSIADRTLDIRENNIPFQEMEYYYNPYFIKYFPQNKFGDGANSYVFEGESLELTANVSGRSNSYQWYKMTSLFLTQKSLSTQSKISACKIMDTTIVK